MSGTGDSGRRWKPPIGAAAKAAFLAAMRSGAPRHEAAAAGGYALNSFYRVARSDLVFRAGWDEAHAVSAEAERRQSRLPLNQPSPSATAGPPPRGELGEEWAGETRIVPNNRRLYQRRPMRHVKFDAKRQQKFLAHFTWSCDMRAAAAEAGVSESTVGVHLRTNPAFRAEFDEALDRGYVLLEAEALRQRLDAQRQLRAAIDASVPGEPSPVLGDLAAEFERVLKLLSRWDRKGRRPERLNAADGSVWTFDAAIALLDKRLSALGVAVPPLPAAEAARFDSGGEEGVP